MLDTPLELVNLVAAGSRWRVAGCPRRCLDVVAFRLLRSFYSLFSLFHRYILHRPKFTVHRLHRASMNSYPLALLPCVPLSHIFRSPWTTKRQPDWFLGPFVTKSFRSTELRSIARDENLFHSIGFVKSFSVWFHDAITPGTNQDQECN